MFFGLNTVKQGTVGLTAAIHEFTKRNWIVSIPLNDTQDYDLVLDQGNGLKKVQVKTTSCIQYGNYIAQLKSVRPNRTTNVIKNLDITTIDFLFVLCNDQTMYLIPAEKITSKTSISLGKKYAEYKL